MLVKLLVSQDVVTVAVVHVLEMHAWVGRDQHYFIIMLLAVPTEASAHLHVCALYVSCWWVFLFTVFYLLDYIDKSITVDGEKIMLSIADTAAAEKRMDSVEGIRIRVDVSWSFKCYIKDIQRTLCTDNCSTFHHSKQ